ncbi:hypothetical protein NI17_018360 [Thermobifida halotolerans]|uniref:Uncharacterized protein n=1 Tax=Thermobifida halotolerans TaxID=483545 RepID=A0A399FWD8_9ACTN|nr:hypothetical protein [Thermobifida halotolerans]UOE18732.1 hypothetical protein NI17_018360 [Thermobifida halotolerans]
MLSGLSTVSSASTVSTAEPLPTRGNAVTASPEGIGDIVMAGARSGYAHLAARPLPTVGRLVPAARGAADALTRLRLWPRRHGHWQRPPRAVRRYAPGRARMAVVALAPNEFVALSDVRSGGPPVHGDVLLVARGRVHAVVTGEGGHLLAVQELVAGRTRVLGGVDGRQLVNTGAETAVVVRVTA